MYILAVDDDPIILEILGHFLGTLPNHELVTATSVAEAVTLLEHSERVFDCFMLDIQMPVTDGIEFCHILRAMPTYTRTPILMLTAMTEKMYIDRAFSAGATDYINKPFELNSLKGRLGLMEQIAEDAKEQSAAAFATTTSQDANTGDWSIELHRPFPIFDVEGVIENHAIENYVAQLSRKSLSGSVVLGFTVREVADLYFSISSYDFACAMTDVAEAISDCLLPTQRLVSYAGSGTFVCAIEGGVEIDSERLVDQINRYISLMELSQSDGTPISARICAGSSKRLVWRKGEAAIEALRQAHDSAEQEAARLDKQKGSIWLTTQSA